MFKQTCKIIVELSIGALNVTYNHLQITCSSSKSTCVKPIIAIPYRIILYIPYTKKPRPRLSPSEFLDVHAESTTNLDLYQHSLMSVCHCKLFTLKCCSSLIKALASMSIYGSGERNRCHAFTWHAQS